MRGNGVPRDDGAVANGRLFFHEALQSIICLQQRVFSVGQSKCCGPVGAFPADSSFCRCGNGGKEGIRRPRSHTASVVHIERNDSFVSFRFSNEHYIFVLPNRMERGRPNAQRKWQNRLEASFILSLLHSLPVPLI